MREGWVTGASRAGLMVAVPQQPRVPIDPDKDPIVMRHIRGLLDKGSISHGETYLDGLRQTVRLGTSGEFSRRRGSTLYRF
jgi:hypothetical protein